MAVPAPDRLRVLESFRQPRPTTNPYLSLLLGALRAEGHDVRTFSWRAALAWRYDVLHLHWPEVLLRGTSGPKTAARQLLFAGLLLRVALLRTAVVRTVHNPVPHESGGPVERALLALCDRLSTARVHLVASTLPAALKDDDDERELLVPHGHYRDWYPASDAPVVPGRLLHFGILRPYKNVEALLAAAHDAPGDISLRVVGAPATEALRHAVQDACASDPRTTASLGHCPDAELAAEVAAAELVVLPYTELHSSGAALLALSLDTPVLVPANPTTAALAAEVGPGWVLTYEGELTPEHLVDALATVRRPGRSDRPDLSAREWPTAARTHATAFRAAAAARHATAAAHQPAARPAARGEHR
ncbi:beta-1,4-mannosyltransferase [Quadrisphaera granulorum]|uniref:Beta-1,4-mannosyltransferase n=1 Tax=Quadrisphaera granulorum TaxID=317664 RepID=A0A316AFL8_9ACTN|nr:hypothetical protein [Quadrisphaera granulorum]PWJ56048.1 beta-1,4-mannosyltransferase [Quadrisphaera granulorum]SZE94682.1 beta-1,4-mannosyltransferase [Quadrisphaera granulorum]